MSASFLSGDCCWQSCPWPEASVEPWVPPDRAGQSRSCRASPQAACRLGQYVVLGGVWSFILFKPKAYVLQPLCTFLIVMFLLQKTPVFALCGLWSKSWWLPCWCLSWFIVSFLRAGDTEVARCHLRAAAWGHHSRRCLLMPGASSRLGSVWTWKGYLPTPLLESGVIALRLRQVCGSSDDSVNKEYLFVVYNI